MRKYINFAQIQKQVIRLGNQLNQKNIIKIRKNRDDVLFRPNLKLKNKLNFVINMHNTFLR